MNHELTITRYQDASEYVLGTLNVSYTSPMSEGKLGVSCYWREKIGEDTTLFFSNTDLSITAGPKVRPGDKDSLVRDCKRFLARMLKLPLVWINDPIPGGRIRYLCSLQEIDRAELAVCREICLDKGGDYTKRSRRITVHCPTAIQPLTDSAAARIEHRRSYC